MGTASNTEKHIAKYLIKSGLMSRQQCRRNLRAFHAHSENRGKEAFLSFLVSKSELTEWQRMNLLEGKWKGFLLDNFMLLDHLRALPGHSEYLAVETDTGERVVMGIWPPTKERSTFYRVLGRHEES
jgi:hypothetical protein